MTICRFYANGYCRYGNNCRFEHDYPRGGYQNTYNRNDGRQSQPMANNPNKVNFRFNRPLDTNTSNNSFGQQTPFNTNSSNFRLRDTQMSSQNRNQFQSPNQSFQTNQKTFSFNRALQQTSSNEMPSSRSAVHDDIEMDSSAVSRMQANSGPQTNPFGLFSQSNNSNLFGNRPQVSPQNEIIANTNPSTIFKTCDLNSSEDIYSKISDLTESDKKQFECNSFTYKSIPICPPPQSLCL